MIWTIFDFFLYLVKKLTALIWPRLKKIWNSFVQFRQTNCVIDGYIRSRVPTASGSGYLEANGQPDQRLLQEVDKPNHHMDSALFSLL